MSYPFKHGQNPRSGETSEYRIWCGLKYRCYNKNCKEYYLYGGRGITICDEWFNSFQRFFDDMGKKPSSKHSLDRYPNQNGNYEPGNCRWATSMEQGRNKRTNVWIEHNGLKMIQKDWAHYFKTTPSILILSIKRKGSFEAVYNYYKNRKW